MNHATKQAASRLMGPEPSSEDYELSVDCEKVWLARQSYIHRTRELGRQSSGVWTVSRDEVNKLKLQVKADKVDGNPSHSVILFPKKDKSKRRDAARRLAAYANSCAISKIGK